MEEIEERLGLNSNSFKSLDNSLNETSRINIDTQSLLGSINLEALRIDDIVLKKYNETLDEESSNIRLLSPLDTKNGYEISSR